MMSVIVGRASPAIVRPRCEAGTGQLGAAGATGFLFRARGDCSSLGLPRKTPRSNAEMSWTSSPLARRTAGARRLPIGLGTRLPAWPNRGRRHGGVLCRPSSFPERFCRCRSYANSRELARRRSLPRGGRPGIEVRLPSHPAPLVSRFARTHTVKGGCPYIYSPYTCRGG